MRLGFVVSDLAAESAIYTSTRVALAARRRGHEILYANVADFRWADDGLTMRARAASAADAACDGETYLATLLAEDPEPVPVDGLDLLWLRCEPGIEAFTGAAVRADMSFHFGCAAQRAGVTVLSDPGALAAAVADKAYTLTLPAEVRPRTMVSRDPGELVAFVADLPGGAVLKPFQGARAESIFFVGPADPNLQPAIETLVRYGYVVAQQYLPATKRGVDRLLMLDGRPLEAGGRTAVVRHLAAGTDWRTNFRVSARLVAAEFDAGARRVAEAVGPQLAADGLFLVGLDIVDGLLLEANVFAPGGLDGAARLQGADFAGAVVEAMETRVGAAAPPARAARGT